MIGIYKIESPSGKVYIGQSRNLLKRISEYKCLHLIKRQPLIFRSIKKYGFDSHTFKIIVELPIDIEQIFLDHYEQIYMDLYRNSGHQMLNLKNAGSRGSHLPETKKKISSALKGRPISPETRAARLGKKHSEATIIKMSQTRKGRNIDQKQKERISKWAIGNKFALGYRHTPEAKHKIRLSKLGKKRKPNA